MVAIQHPTALPAPCLLPTRPAAAPRRPNLRVLEGGRSPRRLAATYRRRRLLVLAVAVVVAVLAIVGVVSVAGAVRAHVRPAAPAAAAASGALATVVAQPGDTLWSIAEGLPHRGDVRVLVDRLVALNGGTQVRAGQAVRVPAG